MTPEITLRLGGLSIRRGALERPFLQFRRLVSLLVSLKEEIAGLYAGFSNYASLIREGQSTLFVDRNLWDIGSREIQRVPCVLHFS